jgi:DMSO reductase anchor subunit
MHPAYSVLFFTTLSGAGYGLLVWLALLALAGNVPVEPRLGIVAFGTAFALIGGGLLSSTAHLGRPARAWRAFSQWRTSWLSREGVLAAATFLPAGAFALGWVVLGGEGIAFTLAALLTVPAAIATVYCTGMIYQSLPTIRAWAHPLVTPVYIVLGLATGGTLALFLLAAFGQLEPVAGALALGLNVIGAVMKREYWQRIDNQPVRLTAGAATGLGRLGDVRVLDPPHTGENFVLREMGYAVARRHAQRLRVLAIGLGLVAPALLIALALVVPSSVGVVLLGLAVIGSAVGTFTERWLFFAEARHVVMLYYGAAEA